MAKVLESELATPPFPLALSYVWDAWSRIRRRTAVDGMTGRPLPITWPDIDAFMRCARVRLDPQDIGMIEALDNLYIVAQAGEASASDKRQAMKDSLAAKGKGFKNVSGKE